MASKSTGQIIGTVAGAVIGFFAGGNVMLGAAIGGAIGGMIDPPKGPTIVGPRLDDLSFQTSTLGAPLGRAYGTVPVLGNVVWLEGDAYREVITSEEQGGKGGSSATYETAHYYATFAVSLLRVPDATKTVALRRMWIGSNLVYDAGSDDIESIIASNSHRLLFTFYGGTDTQQPNTRWQADKGANAVSGFPGRCYIVIYDLDLEPYSRSLAMAQVKCELAVEAVPDIDLLDNTSDTLSNKMAAASVDLDRVEYMLFSFDGFDNLIGAEIREYKYGESDKKISDVAVVLNSGYGYTAPQIMPCQQYAPEAIEGYAIISLYYGGPLRMQLVLVNEGGYVLGEQVNDGDGGWEYGASYIFASKNGEAWAASSTQVAPILHFRNANLIGYSSISVKSSSVGYSENYVFVADATNSDANTCVVKKLDYDLNLVDTLTLDVDGSTAVLQVVGDDEFFIRSSAVVSHYINGTAQTLLVGSVLSYAPTYSWSYFSPQTLDYGISLIYNSTPYVHKIYISHLKVDQSAAKLRDIVTAECALSGLPSSDIDLTGLTDSNVRGYRIASAASIRSSLEMLQAAYPFDVAPSGYKLRFLSRGGNSLATIPEVDLGTDTGGDKLPVLLPVTREMDTQIPYKVSVRYIDPAREYDIAEQYAERPDTASVNERTVELSIVLTGTEAVQIADVLNQKDWIERSAFGPFSLPPTWRAIEPPDVITVEHRGQSHTLRLTRAEFLPDGRIECAGVPSSAQSYTSTATAQESLTTGQSLVPLAGSTTGYLLDIPRVLSNQDVPGMAFGLLGRASGWPGGVLLRSDDQGTTWNVVGTMNSAARVFTASGALSSHHGYSVDHAELIVAPETPGGTLSSVTEDQLFSWANLAAYGADGRWELVAFKTVIDNTGTYSLRDFLRGLYGTEWATGQHVAGDLMIMLDTATVSFFGLQTEAIGSQRLYRAVTQGAAIDSAANVPDTYDANNLDPLSPVDIRGTRNPITLDWKFGWDRRTRWPVSLFSGSTVPLAETSESYEVEVWDNTFSTLKRTLPSVTSATADYPLAQQITDFGIEKANLGVRVYQMSSVSGRGFVGSRALNIILANDPFIDNVVLLMHFEGANNSTTFTDVYGHTFTVTNAYLSTTSPLVGTSSGYFNGSAYVSTPAVSDLLLGSNDFTCECFISPTSVTGSLRKVFGVWSDTSGAGFSWRLHIGSSAQLIFSYSSTGGDQADITSANSIVQAGVKKHVAISRLGNDFKIFYDGAVVASGTIISAFYAVASTKLFELGRDGAGNTAYYTGYLDELRLTKACRYTSAFTPPAGPFPDP